MSKPQRLSVDQTQSCIFYLNVSTSEKLYAFTTIKTERNLRAITDKLEQIVLIGRLSGSNIRNLDLSTFFSIILLRL